MAYENTAREAEGSTQGPDDITGRYVDDFDPHNEEQRRAVEKELRLEMRRIKATKLIGRGIGRPSDYRVQYCGLVELMGYMGFSRAEMCTMLDCTQLTFRQWQKENPEFLTAVRKAEDKSLSWWERTGRDNITHGAVVSAALYARCMSGRFPNSAYRERPIDEAAAAAEGQAGVPARTRLLERLGKLRPEAVEAATGQPKGSA